MNQPFSSSWFNFANLMVVISIQATCTFHKFCRPRTHFGAAAGLTSHDMDEEKVKVVALAVHTLASMVQYAVVMAVQYLEIIGDDSVSDQVK